MLGSDGTPNMAPIQNPKGTYQPQTPGMPPQTSDPWQREQPWQPGMGAPLPPTDNIGPEGIGFSGADPNTGAGYSGGATPGQSAFPSNTTPAPPPTPQAPAKEGFDWSKLIGQSGPPAQMAQGVSRGMGASKVPTATIDPKTGLLRWEGGVNIA